MTARRRRCRGAIRAVTGEADLERLVAIVNATSPEDPTSLDEIRWSDATYPGTTRSWPRSTARRSAAATVGRIYMYPPEYPALWGSIGVLPAARRRGIGERLLREISDAARVAGKTELAHPLCRGPPRGHRIPRPPRLHGAGAVQDRPPRAGRGSCRRRSPCRPASTLTTLAARPDLVEGVHAVALETFADIPGGDEPMAAGDLAEFRARDVDRPADPQGRVLRGRRRRRAAASSATPACRCCPVPTTLAWHDMTAVLPRVSRPRASPASSSTRRSPGPSANGLTTLETGNDEGERADAAVNARLGYRPLPDEVTMRGPLFGGIMAR